MGEDYCDSLHCHTIYSSQNNFRHCQCKTFRFFKSFGDFPISGFSVTKIYRIYCFICYFCSIMKYKKVFKIVSFAIFFIFLFWRNWITNILGIGKMKFFFDHFTEMHQFNLLEQSYKPRNQTNTNLYEYLG